ncbi:MAG: saccharopine dehydrogenase C-terminal domain-containing protein [Acidobacteriota bacterium]|jgi:saccharopine dehydrogenase-like NADP-dependent oxidoreductase
MTTRVIVLGAGRIGSTIALDLASRAGWDVCLADARPEALRRLSTVAPVRTLVADLADPGAVARAVAGHDLAIGALPSHFGFGTLETLIDAGIDTVDISFMAEDALRLDRRARERGVTVVVDCGVAPGISNLLAGWAAAALDPAERLEIQVGGLPVERRWPYDYKAGFAPGDVLEEYVRPARVVESGRMVVREALSDRELIHVPGVGTVEAFLTDGLRTLAETLSIPFMKERTLRYPGHAELVRALRETGFFSKQALEAGGSRVRPLDLTAALLFPKWEFQEGEPDLTVLRVDVEGKQDGRSVRFRWEMVDRFDPATGLRSMSRTTAFPAAVMAGMLADGSFRRPGVCAPEVPGAVPGLMQRMMRELEARGVRLRSSIESLEAPPVAAAL